MIENYPLCWPDGWPRFKPTERIPKNAFQVTLAQSRDHLLCELDRLGASQVIVSTNIPTRRDGLLYANEPKPADPGAAVYFQYNGKPMCFACDRYISVRSNLRSIGLTIEAIRAIERHGASDMMERAFRGFAALPEQTSSTWRHIFGFGTNESLNPEDIDRKFSELVHVHHPDKGGDSAKFQELLRARESARTELFGLAKASQ